ncbi:MULTISPECIES: hypothetical protein [unclassified Curtobacterium]|uniref:hypothetical protein n=1 Tax=unclassified Curtobacterium TaxID=257496 RepID=UPI0038245229
MSKLHYAGHTFDVGDSVTSADLTTETGTIQVRTKAGGFLTITTGPGIAIALEELPARDESRPPRTVTVL